MERIRIEPSKLAKLTKQLKRSDLRKPRRAPNRIVFTDLAIKRLKVPADGQLLVWDKVQHGLSCLISAGGARTFRSQFKLHGKWVTKSIGRFAENSMEIGEDFSVRAARERCRLDRAMAHEGKDPRSLSSTKITVKRAIDKFIEERCKPRQRSWDQAQASLLRSCKKWLDRPVEAVSRTDVREHLKAIVKEGKHATARQSLAWVKTMWKWLASEELIEHDTMHPLQIETVKRVRDRIYSAQELRMIWQVAGKLSEEECAYVRLMILLAPRKTALALMKWGDLDRDLSLWTTPDELVKKKKTAPKRAYKTPLAKPARDILMSMKRGNANDRVFPSLLIEWTEGGRPTYDSTGLKRRLVAKKAPKDFGLHAFRHTMATWLENRGYDLYDRSLVLNHSLGGVTAGYSHGHALERKKQVLEAWADHISLIIH